MPSSRSSISSITVQFKYLDILAIQGVFFMECIYMYLSVIRYHFEGLEEIEDSQILDIQLEDMLATVQFTSH